MISDQIKKVVSGYEQASDLLVRQVFQKRNTGCQEKEGRNYPGGRRRRIHE